ncbi:transposase [Pasteurella atlantica]|uniref:Mutator family transposase n=1 Tax=Pasteurella atlantica TaxID=2827233 RepID=A0AAW8CSW1_9PAST|nr:transposase [Pasteurella atlantica]MDP8040441.1 transposase [Pasteurella atlantica]MDP8042607.1 transposase [Pasteurella atlantica]MDP8044698.1 transposase [Pasteurella atlantica]MDP8046746.1 transposase [Pasteurella atlantica]MDP8062621.1 transposase [Pasteurella atlantica]
MEALLEQLDSQEDIANATQLLHKRFFEKSLNAELDVHLGYQKNTMRKGSNARNGVTTKTVYSEEGKFSIGTPRDREGTFEPEIIKKRQTRVPTLDSKIIHLYSQGMSTREITETVSELYGTEVFPALISIGITQIRQSGRGLTTQRFSEETWFASVRKLPVK